MSDAYSYLRLVEDTLELEPDSLRGDERLDDLEWDSLSVISFMALADEQLGRRLSPRDINGCSDVTQLVALLDAVPR